LPLFRRASVSFDVQNTYMMPITGDVRIQFQRNGRNVGSPIYKQNQTFIPGSTQRFNIDATVTSDNYEITFENVMMLNQGINGGLNNGINGGFNTGRTF
jgi:hypothetical protein